jgi:hypothetical protein
MGMDGPEKKGVEGSRCSPWAAKIFLRRYKDIFIY